ncbi:MFS transporter [Kibdelosporangium phytohabitans]|uniref:Major facilitator superfamily (MFS) profile domain-containing protein n=1 Tax=Kibdelosporangium phytohabitans TaxID=860235 RepID=A0A0N9I1H7_9PSEU|nr:MFS transporter [Kibdelosporangium phytohabitans]ALG09881.1 hypothetical protein AOZ06_25950 [Kibdelosporangium phytohabitans]MBE1468718.1 MFS family permease [Kibdelosporangium phytohabitans]
MTWVVVFGAFMGALDSSLVDIGLDTISQTLGAPLTSVQWVASGYLLALGAALPISAWLGRRMGTGRLWLASLVAFTVTSVLCAVAPDLPALVVMRVLQGLAGGFLGPAGQAVIGQIAGPRRLGRVMSIADLAVVVAPAIGPATGGLSVLSYGIIQASGPGGLHAAEVIVTLALGARRPARVRGHQSRQEEPRPEPEPVRRSRLPRGKRGGVLHRWRAVRQRDRAAAVLRAGPWRARWTPLMQEFLH